MSLSVDVRSFDVRLVGVKLSMGLRLDTIDLRGTGLFLQKDPFAAKVERPGEATIAVGKASLAAFLEAQSPAGLQDFSVDIVGGRVIVRAIKKVLFDVQIVAACRLTIRNEKQLYVELDNVEVMGGASMTNLVRSQIDAINPVLDVKDLPINITLTEVEMEAGQVVLRGRIQPI